MLPPSHPPARRRRLRLVDPVDESWISVLEGPPVDAMLRSIAPRTGTEPRAVRRIDVARPAVLDALRAEVDKVRRADR